VALRQMISKGLKPPVLVFVASKERAKQLHAELKFDKVHCDYISADQSQAARSAAVEAFRAGRTWMLIATDIVGRGMDFLGVNTVVNYDFPGTKSDYIHRCRTSSFDCCCLEHRSMAFNSPGRSMLCRVVQPFVSRVSWQVRAFL
jgi:superfamily II DNA/RNA helicase